MHLSETLSQRVSIGRAALLHHPQLYLEPGYRRYIYGAFGPRLNRGVRTHKQVIKSGLHRRIHLGTIAAQKVMPCWTELWPDDNLPESILLVTDSLIKGTVLPEAAETFRAQKVEEVINLFAWPNPQQGQYQRSVSVAMCAVSALSIGLFDEEFDENELNANLRETDIDPFDSDAARWANLAYSGPIWNTSDFNPNRSLEFWTWWLDKAVPAAFQSVRDE